jgi:hypothetical protein
MEIQSTKGQTWPDGKPLSCPVVDPAAVMAARTVALFLAGKKPLNPKAPDARERLDEFFSAAGRASKEILALETALHEHAHKLFEQPKPPKKSKPSAN